MGQENQLASDEETPPAPRKPWPAWALAIVCFLEWVAAISLCGLIAYGSFRLFIRENEFPLFYHPDEWSKIRQMQNEGYRNFNHPLLMLETAAAFNKHFNVPIDADDDPILFAGRKVSALLAAGAVFALTLGAFAVKRWPGLLIGAATCALCPPLLIYAHYFKEDTSLIFGVSVTLLGAAIVGGGKGHLRSWIGTIVLGAGVALAASGKYVGVAVAAPALVAVLFARPASFLWAPLRLILFVGVAVPLCVWINAPAFEDPWTLTIRPGISEHLEDEYHHATVDHFRVGLTTPNTFLLRTASLEMMPHLWGLIAAGVVCWIFRRSAWRWPIIIGVFVLTWCVVLSRDAIPIRRYSLPLTITAYFTAACAGAYAVASIKWRWTRLAVLVVAAGSIGIIQYRRCDNFTHQFADDSRQRLRNWIILNLPPNSRILADQYSHLGHGGDSHRFPDQPRGRQNADEVSFAGSQGSLERVAANWDYVVVSEPTYERFFVPESHGVEGGENFFNSNRKFHEDLFAKGKEIWSAKPEFPSYTYVNPYVRVFDVRGLRTDRVPAGGNRPPQRTRGSVWPFR